MVNRNLAVILESLTVTELRERLRELEREESAVKLLLRAAIARHRDRLREGRYPKMRNIRKPAHS